MRYILDKMSSPGWEFKTDHLHHIVWMLDKHVCKECKWTREDWEHYNEFNMEPYDEMTQECLDKGMNPYSYCDWFPENYDELSDDDKISWLLDTACGCEFDFIDREDPESGIRFVEIGDDT